jgi:hypothetical protein
MLFWWLDTRHGPSYEIGGLGPIEMIYTRRIPTSLQVYSFLYIPIHLFIDFIELRSQGH